MSVFIVRELGCISVLVRILAFVTQNLRMQDNKQLSRISGSKAIRTLGPCLRLMYHCIHSLND